MAENQSLGAQGEAVRVNLSGGTTAEQGGSLEAGSPGQVDAEAISAALIAAGHLRGGMAELFLDIAFVDLGRRGEASAQ